MRRAVIDIETVRNDFLSQDKEEIKKSALDPIKARVVCIGLIEIDEYRIIADRAFIGLEEKEVLEDFWSYLRHRKLCRFVAHNGLNFDLQFLWKRSVINKTRPSITFDLRKYRNDFLYDTMNVWSNWESRSSIGLNDLSRALGFEGKNGNGSEVEALWLSGEFGKIAEYCLHDCWLTYACYCRMNFAEPVEYKRQPPLIQYAGECTVEHVLAPLPVV